MQASIHPYLTAGVAVLGAGAIALSPIQPITATGVSPAISKALAVNLASSIDFRAGGAFRQSVRPTATPTPTGIGGDVGEPGQVVVPPVAGDARQDWPNGSAVGHYISEVKRRPPRTKEIQLIGLGGTLAWLLQNQMLPPQLVATAELYLDALGNPVLPRISGLVDRIDSLFAALTTAFVTAQLALQDSDIPGPVVTLIDIRTIIAINTRIIDTITNGRMAAVAAKSPVRRPAAARTAVVTPKAAAAASAKPRSAAAVRHAK